MLTRFEAQKYARAAYELGVRYIGGCCAFEPHHVRAMSEELFAERQKRAPISIEYGDILSGIAEQSRKVGDGRDDPKFWQSTEPTTGRPKTVAFATSLIEPSIY